MSTILVTGATGFIGKSLVLRLANRGNQVHALYRGDACALCRHTNIVYERLACYDDLKDIFERSRFDEVIHLATFYSHDTKDHRQIIESNIQFGENVLYWMDQFGCRNLINITTCAEFDSSGVYSPNSLYAASKKAFRDLCDFYISCQGFNVIDLVLYDNYGPGDPRRKVLTLLVEHLKNGKELSLSPGGQHLNLVHVDDTVLAIDKSRELFENIAGQGIRRVFCVAPEQSISLKQLAEELELISGMTINAIWGGRAYRENELMTPWRGEILPGWSPKVSLRQGLKDTIDSLEIQA